MFPSGLAHDHEAVCAFSKTHDVWRTGGLEAFLALCHDDITWTVNMDGITVPYGSSSYGKEDLRWRLIQLGTVFDLKAFEIRSITEAPASTATTFTALWGSHCKSQPTFAVG